MLGIGRLNCEVRIRHCLEMAGCLLRRQMGGAPRPSGRPAFLRRDGNIAHPRTARPAVSDSTVEGDAQSYPSQNKQERKQTEEVKSMKKFLLIGLAVSGLALVPWQRADAQITVGLPGVGGISFGFPGGYYAYPTRYNYYPYRYYRRPYYSYSQPYSYYSGKRYSSD